MSIVVFAVTFLTMCIFASVGLSIIAYFESNYIIMAIFSTITIIVLYIIIHIIVDVYHWIHP